MYPLPKKANVYYKLERKYGQSTIASARPIRAKFRDISTKPSVQNPIFENFLVNFVKHELYNIP